MNRTYSLIAFVVVLTLSASASGAMAQTRPPVQPVPGATVARNGPGLPLPNREPSRIGTTLLDEPTQGVDVGAREEIHRIMKKLLEDGKGILMVTSDLDELMNMSHLIAVMKEGRIAALLNADATSRQEVLSYAIGTTSAG